MVRVMIVEANQYLRMGLKLSLENEADLTVVAEFSEAAAAIREAAALQPEVVLLSVELPDVSGFEACLSLLEVLPPVRIIMMTNRLSRNVSAGLTCVPCSDACSSGEASPQTSWSTLRPTLRCRTTMECWE